MANLGKREGFAEDESGQLIIILAVIITMLLAGLSLIYAQNMLAGNEASYYQLTSSKSEIQNLQSLAIKELKYQAENNPNNFKENAEVLNKQIKELYASHGSYASVEVYNVTSTGDSITSFKVKIVFSNPVIDYENKKRVIV